MGNKINRSSIEKIQLDDKKHDVLKDESEKQILKAKLKSAKSYLENYIVRNSILNILIVEVFYSVFMVLYFNKTLGIFKSINSNFNNTIVISIIVGFGIIIAISMFFTLKDKKNNVSIDDMVLDLMRATGKKDDKYEDVCKKLSSILKGKNNIDIGIKDKRYNKRVLEFFETGGICDLLNTIDENYKFNCYFDKTVPNYKLYQYFSSTKNLDNFLNTSKSNDLNELVKQTIDLEKFYEGIIWTIGGIFITASFSIIALGFNFEEIHPAIGVSLGTGIFFIFYMIFMRFRVSLRLYRNASRIYETLLGRATIKYVYDIEFNKYGNSPRIREILQSILYIMIIGCFITLLAFV